MEGHSTSYRDDVFRALMVLGAAINGKEYIERLEAMSQSDLLNFKKTGNIFQLPGQTVPSQGTLAVVQKRLEGIADVVRDVRSSSRKPDYDWIVSRLSLLINEILIAK